MPILYQDVGQHLPSTKLLGNTVSVSVSVSAVLEESSVFTEEFKMHKKAVLM
jgi:hypothetical protein